MLVIRVVIIVIELVMLVIGRVMLVIGLVMLVIACRRVVRIPCSGDEACPFGRKISH